MSDHRALIAALRRPPSSRAAAIDALGDVPLLRAALDEFERSTIDTARAGGASWAEIAAALGLASRQAAEQRRARLGGTPGQRQQGVDKLHRALDTLAHLLDNATDTHGNGRVALARDTVRLALDAPPGQQIDLARLAIEDLRDYARERPRIAAAVRRVAVLTRH
ncbi:hypothetical protein [Virgisporangium aurantiacum]|uniref:Uncharacterized protein n=1 Tax=Virgisporangium aurantiacum TaxID=175570 RepID=A0A8J3ZGR0_9ACTN|nr:hypothetical protein [Virgisporangium aurantiacum]GIJ61575.1 hypothetical protein Vau01_090910 [Virgisporangium aurantiacum]